MLVALPQAGRGREQAQARGVLEELFKIGLLQPGPAWQGVRPTERP